MKVERIDPFTQANIVKEVACVFRESFALEPWYEGYGCPYCQIKYPLDYQEKVCTSCIKQDKIIFLTERWPLGVVMAKFYEEMQKPDSLCVVSTNKDGVVGFAWGFQADNSIPWGHGRNELEKLLDAEHVHNRVVYRKCFYLSELAVLPKFQGRGIGKKLLMKIIKTQKNECIILRTMPDSAMQRLIEKIGGKIIQYAFGHNAIMVIYK